MKDMDISKLCSSPPQYSSISDEAEEKWTEITKHYYDKLKKFEEEYKFSSSSKALRKLHINGFTSEQIWQQLDLQNKIFFTPSDDPSKPIEDFNICYLVAEACEATKGHEEESDSLSDEEDSVGSNGNAEEVTDLVKKKKKKRKKSVGSQSKVFAETADFEFSDSENEVDTFGELALNEPDADEYSDDEEQYPENVSLTELPSTSDERRDNFYEPTEIDTQFLKLRESEWVADNDIIGEKFDLKSEDIDLMNDFDDEEGPSSIMYNDFFDSPENTNQLTDLKPSAHDAAIEDNEGKLEEVHRKKKVHFEDADSEDDENSDDDNNDDPSDHFSDEDNSSNCKYSAEQLDDDKAADKPDLSMGVESALVTSREMHHFLFQGLSTFEREMMENKAIISQMEEENMKAKEWFLRGEVKVDERPENSALEEHLEINVGLRPKPVITGDTSSLIEKIIIGRIKAGAYDDVERVVKPSIDPMEYKKKLILEQDKSKRSLAEIYEQEYIDKEKAKEESVSKASTLLTEKSEEKKLEEHKAIEDLMDEIFPMLDALSNFHYNPIRKHIEVKVVSNLPAISMEEVVPITASDATLLTPGEILDGNKGDLIGDSEKTSTDRKRDRRKKKNFSKAKSRLMAKKLKEQLKKNPSGDLLTTQTSIKIVERAVKKGDIKVLDTKNSTSVKSSTNFFKQLQSKTESVGAKRKWKNEFTKNTKKRKTGLRAASVLL